MDQVAHNATVAVVRHGGHMVQKRILRIIAILLRGLLFSSFYSAGHYRGIRHHKPKAAPITNVRVYAGSHPVFGEKWDLRGHAPDISLWTESGKKVGDAYGERRIVAQGAFIDIPVAHNEHVQNARPHYINLMAGGPDALCISGIEVTYPDGQGVTITGDILKRCSITPNMPRAGPTHIPINVQSKTQMGFENRPPACFLLDGDKSFPHLWMSAVSMRLPDFQPTDARVKEWNKHPERLCTPSPRLFYHQGKVNTKTPIPIWDPPFEVHTDGTDLDPNRVTNWFKMPQKQRKYSDHKKRDLDNLVPGTEDRFPSSTWASRTGLAKLFGALSKRQDTEPGEIKTIDLSLPDHPRRLIVSHHTNFSAIDECSDGTNEGDDFVSLAEKVYCDMKLRNMWHVCDNSYNQGCFDTQANSLRGFELDDDQVEDSNESEAIDFGTVEEDEKNTTSTYVDSIKWNRRRMIHDADNIDLFRPVAKMSYGDALYGMRYANITILK